MKRRIRKELPEFQKNQEQSGCGETPADTDKCKNYDGKKNETDGKPCRGGRLTAAPIELPVSEKGSVLYIRCDEQG